MPQLGALLDLRNLLMQKLRCSSAAGMLDMLHFMLVRDARMRPTLADVQARRAPPASCCSSLPVCPLPLPCIRACSICQAVATALAASFLPHTWPFPGPLSPVLQAGGSPQQHPGAAAAARARLAGAPQQPRHA